MAYYVQRSKKSRSNRSTKRTSRWSPSRGSSSRKTRRGSKRGSGSRERTIRIVLEQPGQVNRDTALMVPAPAPRSAKF